MTDPQLNACIFENARLKGLQISRGKIKHTRFRNCYLRRAVFEQVDLTGCEFVNCNLRNIQFQNCFLDYVRFKDCVLNYDMISSCNFRFAGSYKDALQQMRVHAQCDGAFREARRLLLEELKQDRIHEWNKALSTDTVYYRRNFKGWSRVQAFGKWVLHWIEHIGWGYGLRPSQLLITAIALVILLSGIIALSEMWYRVPYHYSTEVRLGPLGFGEALYFVLVTFSTLGYGEISPASSTARAFSSLVCCLGAIFLGLIAASMFKRMER